MSSTWYHQIIVGVDGSAESMAAVDWAALTADRHSAQLTVLGAYLTLPTNRDQLMGVTAADLHAEALDAVARAVARLDGARPGGQHVQERVVLGDPVFLLTHRSAPNDLVVVGRRGAWGRMALGSVSGALAASAPGPVAVIPAGASTRDPRRVVAGVSGHGTASQLDIAFAEAQQRSCPLVVVHALETALMDLDLGGPDVQELDAEREAVRQQVAQWSEKYPTVSATVEFRKDDVAHALLRGLSPEDLVVMGGRPHSLTAGRIRRSVPDTVLRQSPCPVIVAHH